MSIMAHQPGWAEQDPEMWWKNLITATKKITGKFPVQSKEIGGIGISYQMHGLVLVDKDQNVIRPSIIWCDSRAVETGKKAFEEIGRKKCLENLLNSPGNFTASKLKWVKDNEPEIYGKIYKMMLPGDYIAMKLTGEINTTVSGLSEGIFWDFKKYNIADFLLNYYGLDPDFIPVVVPTFTEQVKLSKTAAGDLGLKPGIKVAYRAGDQPNNAFSLNVLNPGEIAATAGTSGVVYGISEEIKYDPKSRVNTFIHVNHEKQKNRLGILLCINGTGILNSWLKRNFLSPGLDYVEMNKLASKVPIGSENVSVLPFGNGAERMLQDQDIGSQIVGLNFNIHTNAHIFRAAQEGIVFAFKYGMDIMKDMGIRHSVIRAGNTNMFLSPVFRETLAGISGSYIVLYNTDGSQGAARAAGVGTGYFRSFEDAFSGLKKIDTIEPDIVRKDQYEDAYKRWTGILKTFME